MPQLVKLKKKLHKIINKNPPQVKYAEITSSQMIVFYANTGNEAMRVDLPPGAAHRSNILTGPSGRICFKRESINIDEASCT